MKHPFCHRWYNIKNHRNRKDQKECGYCDYEERVLDVPMKGKECDDLDTLLHEGIHACMPFLEEEIVAESATDIAKFLWKLGWRKEN